ncbi:MAG: hypothetical protein M1820_010776 [Bogoriella megaspora]|nr:MAG: hypothetical protein M1820_010776 [Bogoriella megaspora]
MSAETETKQWILTNKPVMDPVFSGANPTFTLQTTKLSAPKPDEVLVKALHLSNDPAQRAWIQRDADPARMYTAPVPVGVPMRAMGICEVVTAGSDSKFQAGQLVFGSPGWSQYAVLPAAECRPIDTSAGISPTYYIGVFGGPGTTAWYGLIDIARTSKDDGLVVISGAAGATGSIAVQIAKHVVGVKKVVGIAGSEEKCRWVESIGADVCINYKTANFTQELKNATEGFADVYFDNVGGEILDLMLTRMKKFGRVTACGAIANYNKLGDPTGVKHWSEIIMNRIEVKGFVVLDAYATGRAGEIRNELVKAYKEGKVKIDAASETVVETKFEDIPKTWMMLFEGGNQGKLVTKLV